jgi:hypothetical protein
MAHFAKIENNIVVDVHVVDNYNLLDENGIEQEQIGIDYLKSLWGDQRFLQCSYNGSIRKRYPGIGYSYDEVNDVYIAPRPFASWTLNENFDWEAPVAEPVTELPYIALWNEENVNWDIVDITLQTR